MTKNKEKIIEYYNNESELYSMKRYPEVTTSLIQFLFKKRRDIVESMLLRITKDRTNLRLIDIACADGILTDYINKKFPSTFKVLVGSDIAPKMIEKARKTYKSDNMNFYVRDDCPTDKFDIALGLGYLSMSNYSDERIYLKSRLIPGGYYICTFVSKKSIINKIKHSGESYTSDYLTFKEYEDLLRKDYEIIDSMPYGLLVPKIWTIPVLARIIQPIFESIFSSLVPDLFHEKVYLLKTIN
jgi:SAM-dependent methyltransferase